MPDSGLPDSKPIAWTPSSVLPKERTSFARIGYGEMLERAKKLKPVLAQRAEECERLRRLPEETERDLHEAGLFRVDAEPAEFAQDMYGIMLAFHFHSRLMGDAGAEARARRAFTRLLEAVQR